MTERGLKNINVFYSTFTNFFYIFVTFFYVFNVFIYFFLERFFTSMLKVACFPKYVCVLCLNWLSELRIFRTFNVVLFDSFKSATIGRILCEGLTTSSLIRTCNRKILSRCSIPKRDFKKPFFYPIIQVHTIWRRATVRGNMTHDGEEFEATLQIDCYASIIGGPDGTNVLELLNRSVRYALSWIGLNPFSVLM